MSCLEFDVFSHFGGHIDHLSGVLDLTRTISGETFTSNLGIELDPRRELESDDHISGVLYSKLYVNVINGA